MTTPTPADLADQLRRTADLVQALGGTPSTPTAGPAQPAPSGVPVKPTGLRVEKLTDGRLQLAWNPAPDATGGWDVIDQLDPVSPVKETVPTPWSVRSAMTALSRARRYAVVARNAAGPSEPSDPVDVPALVITTAGGSAGPVVSAPTGDPASPSTRPRTGALPSPSQLLNLGDSCYLTLPTTAPGGTGPRNVHPPELDGFSHEFWRVVPDPLDPARLAVRAEAPTNPPDAANTKNSGATRTEPRQLTNGELAAWSWDDDVLHTLTGTLICDASSIIGRREVIVGQVHGAGHDGIPLILAVNQNPGKNHLEVFRQGPGQGAILSAVGPRTRFSYRIEGGRGWCKIYAALGDADRLPAEPQMAWPSSDFNERTGLYLKGVGAYNKQERSTARGGSAVVWITRSDIA